MEHIYKQKPNIDNYYFFEISTMTINKTLKIKWNAIET